MFIPSGTIWMVEEGWKCFKGHKVVQMSIDWTFIVRSAWVKMCGEFVRKSNGVLRLH